MSQFLSENSNNLIVETSIKFWSKIYNILGYMKKSIFSKFGLYFRWKMWRTVNRNFLKKNRKNPIFWWKINVIQCCITSMDQVLAESPKGSVGWSSHIHAMAQLRLCPELLYKNNSGNSSANTCRTPPHQLGILIKSFA